MTWVRSKLNNSLMGVGGSNPWTPVSLKPVPVTPATEALNYANKIKIE